GLNDGTYQSNFGNGWIWGPDVSNYVVAVGATAPINATGITFAKFGTTDLQLTIDTTMLAPGTWDTSAVGVKGSAWSWNVQDLQIVSGKATFTVSAVVGAGKPFNHSGLFNPGDKPEFIFVFGTGREEYRGDFGVANTMGITAGVKAEGAST